MQLFYYKSLIHQFLANFGVSNVFEAIMRSLNIYYFLFVAVFMLAAKPFLGFSAHKHIRTGKAPSIFVKAFTKRKQEFVEESAYDVATIQKRLANPQLPTLLLFLAALSTILPFLISNLRRITLGLLSNIRLTLIPVADRYLLSGKLTI